MGKQLKVRKLDQHEDSVLYEALRSDNKNLARKCFVTVWFTLGKDLQELDSIMPVHSTTIRRWVKAFNKRGVDFLKPTSKLGRPQKADELFEGAARHALQKSPRRFGYDADQWTAKLLREHLHRVVDRDVSIRTVYTVISHIKETQ